jgi:hypothetical protein
MPNSSRFHKRRLQNTGKIACFTVEEGAIRFGIFCLLALPTDEFAFESLLKTEKNLLSMRSLKSLISLNSS